MDKSKSGKLFIRCPTIYRYRTERTERGLIWFGFECNSGWFEIIYQLSIRIEDIAQKLKNADEEDDKLPLVIQVKEKFNTLRFYVRNTSPNIQNLISEAEAQSSQTCEKCGQKGALKCRNGYYATLCSVCEICHDD
jgi:hypothetical protein